MEKEMPHMMLPRRFIFGMLEVPCWQFMWGYTKPLVELAYSDGVVTKYGKDAQRDPQKRVDETMRRWNERRRRMSMGKDILGTNKQGTNG